MSDNSVRSDAAFIRLYLLNEALRQVEKLPYPGEIQSCLSRRKSLINLAELLYNVCGCEKLPEIKPLRKAEKLKPAPEKSQSAPETKALMDFLEKAGGNVLRSAASQAARTGSVNADTAKRAAVSGIAKTISLMMREDRNK